jgi:hypothetical protein
MIWTGKTKSSKSELEEKMMKAATTEVRAGCGNKGQNIGGIGLKSSQRVIALSMPILTHRLHRGAEAVFQFLLY